MRFLPRWRRRKRRPRVELDPAEAQRLRDLQSPVKAKWGYYPK